MSRSSVYLVDNTSKRVTEIFLCQPTHCNCIRLCVSLINVSFLHLTPCLHFEYQTRAISGALALSNATFHDCPDIHIRWLKNHTNLTKSEMVSINMTLLYTLLRWGSFSGLWLCSFTCLWMTLSCILNLCFRGTRPLTLSVLWRVESCVYEQGWGATCLYWTMATLNWWCFALSLPTLLLCHRLSLSGRRPFIAASLPGTSVHCLTSTWPWMNRSTVSVKRLTSIWEQLVGSGHSWIMRQPNSSCMRWSFHA